MKSSAIVVFALGVAFSLFLVSHPAIAAISEAEERFSPYCYPELYIEGYLTSIISNTSNLTDREIRWYLRHADYQSLAKALDRDSDSIADRTRYNVHEFIERMRIGFFTIDDYEKRRQRKTAEDGKPHTTSI